MPDTDAQALCCHARLHGATAVLRVGFRTTTRSANAKDTKHHTSAPEEQTQPLPFHLRCQPFGGEAAALRGSQEGM